MNIKRGQTPRGICSILDYRYGGLRYRPVLGYDLTTEQERAAAIEVMVAIQVNVGLQAPQVNSSRQSVTFCEFAPRYIAYLEAKKLKALERPLTILNRHLIPHFGSITLKRLTMDHGLTYLTKRRAEGAAEGTLSRECGVLQAALNYAVEIDALDKNRLRLLPSPQWESRERIVTNEELFRLFRMASDPVRRLMVVALLTTLRQAKLIEIHEEWLVQRGDGWWMMPSPGSRHKRVPKEVPLSDLALEALRGGLPRIGGRFFAQWKDGSSFKHRWAELCQRAGIHDLNFHDLRHSAASWLLEAGIDYAVIEKLLGHRLHGMGEGYIHNWEHRLREAVRNLEAIVARKLSGTAREIEQKVASRGQLGSYENFEFPKWWILWCRGTESNCRHQPFQGCALPTELPRH
ncbi:MAG: putative Phage integrase [Nitrospira sp.]|nr:putative Phage integrase [Nitrospira sp.]